MKVMRIAQNFEETDSQPVVLDKAFKKGASIKEGVNGRIEIDTTYENREAACSQPEKHYRSDY
jgi:predicted regulator of amino acid metabolism with ACT domain